MTDPKSEPSDIVERLLAGTGGGKHWMGLHEEAAAEIKRLRATLTPAPAQPEPPTYVSQMCQPNGVLFDAFGEPRTRYVRVTLEGRHCVMHPSEGDTYIKDAKDCGDDSEYVVADVYLSEREFEDMGEFDGF